MKRNISPILGILILLIISGGAYWYIDKENKKLIEPISKEEFVMENYKKDSDFSFKEDISLKEGTVRKVNMIIVTNQYDQVRDVEISYIAKINSYEDEYFLEINPGPSGDLHFEYFKKEGDSFVFKGSTPLGVIIPGNGFIYTNGTQDPFNTYMKYKIDSEGKIVEVKQPAQYIGFKSFAKKDFFIMDNEGEIVASVAKNSPVEILLWEKRSNNDGIKFLIKTQYNILGWYDYKDVPSCFNKELEFIDGLCFGGD